MRTLILFALALAGTALLTDDASAIGKRKRAQASSGCGGCGAPVAAAPSCGGCTTGAPGYMGAPGYPGRVGYTTGMVGGQAATIQATDGQIYTLGADGNYYGAAPGTTLGGFANQPYTSGYYPGTYRGGYSPYQGVYPAGGTVPLTMPGANIPGTMPPRK